MLTVAVILTAAVALFFALLSFDVLERAEVQKLMGQNYSTAQTVPPEGTN